MKRISAASSAVTLVSAVALMAASGAQASEPVRLSAAQMDAVTAGTNITAFSESIITTVEDGKVNTVRIITTVEDGKTTTKKETFDKPLDAKFPDATPGDIADVRKQIDDLRNSIRARVAAVCGGW